VTAAAVQNVATSAEEAAKIKPRAEFRVSLTASSMR